MSVIAVTQFTIRDTNDITASAVAPTDPAENELWLDLSITPNQLKRYTGSAWVIVNDSADIVSAVQAAQADIDALSIGGRNLIWATLDPNPEPGYRPAINGFRATGSMHSGALEYFGELIHSTGTLEAVEHGVKISTTTVLPVYPYLRFGNAWTAGGSMLGLTPGETYTFSGDVEMKLLSKYTSSSTAYVYATLYHAAEGSSSFTTGSASAGTRYTLGSYTKATAGSVIRKRMEWTFTIPAGTAAVYFNFGASTTTSSYFLQGDYLSISNMKLERGNRATDWTPAPEDVKSEIAAVQNFAEGIRSYSQGIQSQLDEKIDTWFYSVPPSASVPPESEWTAEEKTRHADDLYYDTSMGFCYRYTGSAWDRIKDSDITAAMGAATTAQDTADHKRRVFTATPAPPYDVGDMWAGGSTGDLKVCKTAKATGAAYAAADWVLASKYTDDTAAAAAQSAAQDAQADIDSLTIGGRNLIWGTKNPSVDIGSRPAINGLHSDGTDHGGEMVTSASTTLEETEHGLKATITKGVRPYFRFGTNAAASGTMLGLTAGETYTMSCDAEFKLLSGTQTSTTFYVYFYLYNDAANNGTFAAGSVAAGTAYLLGTYTQALKGTMMSKRVEWTFTIPENATMIYFFLACNRTTTSNYAAGDYISVSNLKLEKGNRVTDWTAAPEDDAEELETKLAAVNARISNEGDSIRQEVQASYALASDMTQVRSQVSTIAEQTENNYTWAVTRVNQLQDDLDTAREATEEELSVMRSYMSFGEDGLSIGKTGNPFTFRVANDRLAFFMNDTEVAYLSNNKLYVTEAEILTRLIIGKLAFEPQTNGNLSLVFRG
ncbi:MAG: hypothetical protein IKS31_00945 [Clostridia bacterium]|nr:hypothetical protein [Clostridia bacterium]